jgi:tetratricopeptide (TPR) repeat protein
MSSLSISREILDHPELRTFKKIAIGVVVIAGIGVIAGTVLRPSTGVNSTHQTMHASKGLSLAETARTALANRDAGYGQAVRTAAAFEWSEGRQHEAIELLTAGISVPESDFELAESLRQSGEYHMQSGEVDQARELFLQCVEIANNDIVVAEQLRDSYLNAAYYTAKFQAARGETDASFKTLEDLLAREAKLDLLSDEQVSSVLLNKARIAEEADRLDVAASALTSVKKQFPDSWNKHRIGFELSLASLLDPTRSSDAYVSSLSELWNDATLESDSRILHVAFSLRESHKARGEHAMAADVAYAAVMMIDAQRETWSSENATGRQLSSEALRKDELSLLASLQSADQHERPEHARFASERLMQVLPDGLERKTAVADLARLSK